MITITCLVNAGLQQVTTWKSRAVSGENKMARSLGPSSHQLARFQAVSEIIKQHLSRRCGELKSPASWVRACRYHSNGCPSGLCGKWKYSSTHSSGTRLSGDYHNENKNLITTCPENLTTTDRSRSIEHATVAAAAARHLGGGQQI